MGTPLTVLVRKASPADSAAIAALHLAEIPRGLLTSMGPAFVTAFYETLVGSDVGFGFLAEREGRAVGFAAGVIHWRRFYRVFVARNWRLAVTVLFRRAFDLRRLRRLLETSRYAATVTLPDAELLAIAVRPEARGTGTADVLVRHVLAEFARRGVRQVRVTTAASNTAAARVYERSGFHLHSKAEIHRGEGACVYVLALQEGAQV